MPNQDDTQPDWMLDSDGLHKLNESNRPQLEDEANEQHLRFPNEYKGWPNYETWAVNIWLTTEPKCYERLMSIVQNPDTRGEQAEALKIWIHIGMGNMADEPEPGLPGMYLDLLAAAFDLVDWREIIRTNSQEDYK